MSSPHIPFFFDTLFRLGSRFVMSEVDSPEETDYLSRESVMSRALEKYEDGSTRDFFLITQALGKGGGPSIDRYSLVTKQGHKSPAIPKYVLRNEGRCSAFAVSSRVNNILDTYFMGSQPRRMLGVAKHLCGGGSDIALRYVFIIFFGECFA